MALISTTLAAITPAASEGSGTLGLAIALLAAAACAWGAVRLARLFRLDALLLRHWRHTPWSVSDTIGALTDIAQSFESEGESGLRSMRAQLHDHDLRRAASLLLRGKSEAELRRALDRRAHGVSPIWNFLADSAARLAPAGVILGLAYALVVMSRGLDAPGAMSSFVGASVVLAVFGAMTAFLICCPPERSGVAAREAERALRTAMITEGALAIRRGAGPAEVRALLGGLLPHGTPIRTRLAA